MPDYHEGSRRLQDRFDTRRLADRIDERIVHDTIDEDDRAFIEARDMFFIATADAEGRPQCSYKGGEPGFVRVLDERTLAFPVYDGNGMFLTAGNALVNPHVGLLFIDFEGRKRLRLNGVASVRGGRPVARRVSRGAARRPGRGDGGVPELPALHPRVPPGRAFAVRAARTSAARPCRRGRRANGPPTRSLRPTPPTIRTPRSSNARWWRASSRPAAFPIACGRSSSARSSSTCTTRCGRSSARSCSQRVAGKRRADADAHRPGRRRAARRGRAAAARRRRLLGRRGQRRPARPAAGGA